MSRAAHPVRRTDPPNGARAGWPGRAVVRAGLVVSLAVLIVALGAASAAAATRFDPALRFRRTTTPHFTIYVGTRSQPAAGRLAVIVEETWTAMQQAGWTVPPHTHVVLADQSDVANGWATPLPYNTVVLLAAWPSGADFIGLTDDWLRLVFTHEFTHIAHLDRSRGWARAVKGVFGRVPLAFPNLSLPTWQIEGIATFFESELTGQGRAHAREFLAIEREPARAGLRVPLDRVNGGLIDWPGGTAVYSAGLGFHDYLAERFGRARLLALADRTAGRLPYFGTTAFTPVFGASLGQLWTDYQQSLIAAESAVPAVIGQRRLTHDGFDVRGVRFLAPRCAGCAQDLAYSVRNPHEFPALKAIDPAGGAPATLTTRYLGDTVGSSAEWIVFDQDEVTRNVGLYGDLFALHRPSGTVRQLTHGLRLHDPDLSPTGDLVVATRQDGDRRSLVLVPVTADGRAGTVRVLRDETDVQYATPRWSPDGRHVAVERIRPEQTSEVVVVGLDARIERIVVRGATRAVTPAWRPDGRALVVAVDRADGPFNLEEFPLDGDGRRSRRLTFTTGGARWPDISRDGRTLAYVGYTPDGFDVFVEPYPGEPAADPEPGEPEPTTGALKSPPAESGANVRRVTSSVHQEAYAPWSTLWPRAWTPVLYSASDQTQVGVSTGGSDVLGYHAWSATAAWRTRSPEAIAGGDRTPDWGALYVYDRWQPQFYMAAARQTSFFTGASAQDDGAATLRELTVESGVVLPVRRVLRSQQWRVSAARTASVRETATTRTDFTRLAARAAWSYRSTRFYGYSISPEHGVAVGLTAEAAGRQFAGLDEAKTATVDLRAYTPGITRHHVLATRLGAGVSSGPRDLGRTFRLGGALPSTSTTDFGRAAFSLLRGFAPDSFAGRRIATFTAEYRLPLLRVERGRGTWPIFLRQFHGSLFVDAANAWRDRFRAADVKTSVGAQLSLDVVAGYSLPFTLTAGVARGHDGSGRLRDRTLAFLQVGRAF